MLKLNLEYLHTVYYVTLSSIFSSIERYDISGTGLNFSLEPLLENQDWEKTWKRIFNISKE